ncbi:MAG: hypothetical protein OWT27_05830 [Firmicutes bacterium]|nr:hypothetical protein [Bacillota bacterium]
MNENDRTQSLLEDVRTRALLHSYAHTATLYAKTGDEGYKKTLGMFRQRLLQVGVRVQQVQEAGDVYIVDVETTGQPSSIQLPRRPAAR